VGFAITEKIRDAIDLIPKKVWTAALDTDGGICEGGDVAELAGLLDLSSGRPACAPSSGVSAASRCAVVAVRGTGRVAPPGLRHQYPTRPARVPRGTAPCPCPGRGSDPTRQGLRAGRFPSREFDINQVWLTLVQVAADLTSWTRLLAPTGDANVLKGCEPKALRYRFQHMPTQLAHSARLRRLRIPESWPYRNRRGLREYRRDPATSLTAPQLITAVLGALLGRGLARGDHTDRDSAFEGDRDGVQRWRRCRRGSRWILACRRPQPAPR